MKTVYLYIIFIPIVAIFAIIQSVYFNKHETYRGNYCKYTVSNMYDPIFKQIKLVNKRENCNE